MIYLGTFGMHDPIRPNVKETINQIKHASGGEDPNPTNVRMVTGDHLSTAIYVAKQTGIVREEELPDPKSKKNTEESKYVAMTGE